MHPFPEAAKLQFLVGEELEQVCLGPWQIQLNFHKARIHVEHDLEHVDKSGAVRRHNTDEDRPSPIFLHRLLGQSVRKVEVEPFCLTVTFDGGDMIRVISEDGPYECGQIYDEHGGLTVF